MQTMNGIERFGIGAVCDRDLSLLELTDLDSLPPTIALPSRHFACLVLLDAQGIEVGSIGRFAESLLSQGAVYVGIWGPDCERVHDIFDEEIVGRGPEVPRFDPGVMTTWHADEDLDDALWFLLEVSYPDDRFFETCGSALVITVGSPMWAAHVREALSDSKAFCRKIGNK
jgi:hypothetical protein